MSKKAPAPKQEEAREPSKEVATLPQANAMVAANADMFEADAGAGMENVTAKDLLIPRLTVLQGLSPQLKKDKPEHIAGAEIGDIVDVGTKELFKAGVLFLPVFYRKDYLEWYPRNSGKGLAKIHTTPDILDQCELNERGQPVLPSGNYVAETAQFFGLNLTADRRKCFLPMASTQLKKAKQWLTMAQSERIKRKDGTDFLAPLYYRTYTLTTGPESNNEGDWSGWKIERSLDVFAVAASLGIKGEALVAEAKEFLEGLRSGAMAAKLDDEVTPTSEAGASAERAM